MQTSTQNGGEVVAVEQRSAEGEEPQGFLFVIQAQEKHATCLSAHFLWIISLLSAVLARLSESLLFLCSAVGRGPIFTSSVDGFPC